MTEFLYKLLFNNISSEGYLFHLFGITVTDGNIPSAGKLAPLFLIALLWLIASYLIGSINCSLLISKYAFHDDIRNHGSKNAGSTNMNRTYGSKAAAVTLLGDMLKGVVAILPAQIFLGANVAYLCGFICVLGHCFPIFFGFKGGKGVATAAAVVLTLNPPVFLLLIVIFVILVAASRYISLGSIMAAFFFPVLLNSMTKLFTGDSPTALMSISAIAIALLLVLRHKENIKKLLNKTESKFSFRKKGDASVSDTPPQFRSLHRIDEEDDTANDESDSEKTQKASSKSKKN